MKGSLVSYKEKGCFRCAEPSKMGVEQKSDLDARKTRDILLICNE